MEENKEGKVINLNKEEKPVETKAKLSYEELENLCRQLSNQSKQLYQKLQEQNNFNAFKRLDYLFKVMEFAIQFDSTFVEKCTKEIEQIMTLDEVETNESENKE